MLILPLFLAAWAFGSYAAANERSRTDTRLAASARTAVSEYGRIVDGAQLQALRLAGRRSVQRALHDHDRQALARLRRAHPNAIFVVGKRTPPAAEGVVRRSASVTAGDRTVGTVVVAVPLDQAHLARIADNAGLSADQEIAVAVRNGRVAAASAPLSGPVGAAGQTPGTVMVGADSYRGVSIPLTHDTRLAILVSSQAVQQSAASIRSRIMLIGLIVLAAVMLLAYSLAPSLARARVAQQQRAVAERVLAHVADGVLLLDEHGFIRFWNRAAERITGITESRALGALVEHVIPGWSAVSSQIVVADARREEPFQASTIVPLELGSREVWLAAAGVRFGDGTVYSFRDITEDERLDRAKTDFVATVSHELRTPLASVYGAALTLQKRFSRLDESARDRLLRLISEEADRLSAIIDDILLASRLDSGQLDVGRDRVDAGDIARAVVDAARVRAPEGIDITLSAPDDLPDATADAEKVGQVLSNLVENAIKYSPLGGHIDVTVGRANERIRFAVRDEGLGIPLGEQERIFKKFYRLDPNLTRGIGGTGLGLYISRELVRRMGGTIRVESSPGRGSTFSFDLPVAPAPSRVAETVGS